MKDATKIKKIMSDQQQKENHISNKADENDQSTYESAVLPSLDNIEMAIPTLYIGAIGMEWEAVKHRLFRMYNHFGNLQIIDLGNSEDLKGFQTAVDNSIKFPHHTTAILTDDTDIIKDLISVYESKKEPWNFGNCSSTGNEVWENDQLDPSLTKSLFHNNLIQLGLQLQDTPAAFFDEMEEEHYEHYRIGNFKENLRDFEPIMRDLQVFQFNCNTLKVADFPAKSDDNPSGFQSEEALQILKYAGLSPNLGFIILRGIGEQISHNKVSIEFLAQALWYITHGLDVRIKDDPYQLENMQEYVVEHDYYDFPIAFLRSKKTGRWWIKIPNTHEDKAPFVCISCSESDYMEVFENKVPYRLVQAIERNR